MAETKIQWADYSFSPWIGLRDRAGGDMAEWPDELCVRELPS